uniref:S-locus receptor kinase C-terminal domain-containing protein n=1 Tax=Salix viminalis TaxID=40686 RepID=A0A6N2M0I0_SALVM
MMQAYDLWKNGRGIEFIDPFLDDSSPPCKLETCMQVALLCVQENPDARPTMLEAFSMLKSDGSLAISTPEGPGFSEKKKGDMETASSSQQVMCSFDDSRFPTGTPRDEVRQGKRSWLWLKIVLPIAMISILLASLMFYCRKKLFERKGASWKYGPLTESSGPISFHFFWSFEKFSIIDVLKNQN